MGVMSYLASPLWLLFLLAGMSLALHAYLVPPDYFLDRWSLFPDWPRIDPERAMALFGICMLVLYAPEALRHRRLPARARLARRARRHRLRPRRRAPALGAGRADHDAGAVERDRADPDRPRQRLGARRRATPTGCPGRCSGASTAGTCSRALLLAGRGRGDLLAAPRLDEPGASRPRARGAALGLHGQRRRRARAGAHAASSLTPEERDPPALAAAADARGRGAPRARPARPRGCAGLLADPEALARHLAWLDPPTARRPGEPDAALANALLKLADGFGPDALDARETFAVLCSPATLAGLAPDRRRAARRDAAR